MVGCGASFATGPGWLRSRRVAGPGISADCEEVIVSDSGFKAARSGGKAGMPSHRKTSVKAPARAKSTTKANPTSGGARKLRSGARGC